MTMFIEKRWLNTKWMFCISFFLYMLFLILFSTFLGLMYFRESNISLQRSSHLCKTEIMSLRFSKIFLNVIDNFSQRVQHQTKPDENL